jgi:hypothetical protein
MTGAPVNVCPGRWTTRSKKPKATEAAEKPVSQGRHEAVCSICAHPQREEIEQEFINWGSAARMAKTYKVCRESFYRHAHAFHLMDKRRRNVRAALEKIIEKAGDVEVNAAAVVSAISAYARINGRGEWVERMETVNLNTLFERMSAQELETYAQDGSLPTWFTDVVPATAGAGEEDSDGK